MVRQPVTMTFDDRGRMWVIQYLQYPTPAGLKPVEVDRYLRTKYDRVPEPPPHGPRGADRITILEDTDGDGRVDQAKDFVTGLESGLGAGDRQRRRVRRARRRTCCSIPTAIGDDVPDGDPEVLLTGFGMEDAHAVVNSLQWGPDGWLYGTQGSTVTADIRGIGFQQGIWRYHPRTQTIRAVLRRGRQHLGARFRSPRQGDRRHQLWRAPSACTRCKAATTSKGFSKHGPLHNPYTYGYFEHCRTPGTAAGT